MEVGPDRIATVFTHLRAVYIWLTGDFLHAINHATVVNEKDMVPFHDAYRLIQREQFELPDELYGASLALLTNLDTALQEFTALVMERIRLHRAADEVGAKQAHAKAAARFDRLHDDFRKELHEVKRLFEKHEARRLRINLPNLREVGGGIIIESPAARNEQITIHAEEGATVDASQSRHEDHGTHVTSSITNSPGAVANVGQNLHDVRTNVQQSLAGSAVSPDVQRLLEELAEKIAALDARSAPAANELASDCQTLTEELVKPQPRRKWWQLSLEGLKEAAVALGEIGKPILETTLKLGVLLAKA